QSQTGHREGQAEDRQEHSGRAEAGRTETVTARRFSPAVPPMPSDAAEQPGSTGAGLLILAHRAALPPNPAGGRPPSAGPTRDNHDNSHTSPVAHSGPG